MFVVASTVKNPFDTWVDEISPNISDGRSAGISDLSTGPGELEGQGLGLRAGLVVAVGPHAVVAMPTAHAIAMDRMEALR